LNIEDVLTQLGTDADRGLSAAEASRRLAKHGLNELEAAHRVSPWMILGGQLKNVLILILLVAIGLSAFLGHGIEAIAIAVIVVFAVLLGFLQGVPRGAGY
jgi:Ca2+-transporting ATPase